MKTLQEDVRSYEPKEALEAGPDGLETYWKFFRQLQQAREHLPRHVYVIVEIDPSQTRRMQQLITHEFPSCESETKQDLAGLDRIVVTKL